jgi:hypothetical protein
MDSFREGIYVMQEPIERLLSEAVNLGHILELEGRSEVVGQAGYTRGSEPDSKESINGA